MRLAFLFLACTAPPAGSDPGAATADTATAASEEPSVRDLPLPEVALLVAHNAMASSDDGYLVPNQHLAFEGQLALGVRGFMLDVHDEGDGPELCHSTCALGRAPLADGLARFESWLGAHPDELIVFVIQDEVPPEPILEAFATTGLDRRAVVPPAAGMPWPSWNALVAAGQQVLVTTEGRHDGVPDWYAHAYTVGFDNDYAATTVDDFDCDVLRGEAGQPFQLVNHFLTAPVASPDLAAEANTEASLQGHVDACETQHGQPVSWLAVDFVGIGAGMTVVDGLNARRAVSPRR